MRVTGLSVLLLALGLAGCAGGRGETTGSVEDRPAGVAAPVTAATLRDEKPLKPEKAVKAKADKAKVEKVALVAPTYTVPRSIDGSATSWYSEFVGPLPRTEALPYCTGFACNMRVGVSVSGGSGAELAAIMAPGAASPDAERAAIEKAVTWFERRAIPLMGGVVDTNGTDAKDRGKMGQTDCIDEAANTTTLLIHMQRVGLLRHHTVQRPVARGGLTHPHVTAVLKDLSTGTDWAVDSWVRDGGLPPEIMTVVAWDAWMATAP